MILKPKRVLAPAHLSRISFGECDTECDSAPTSFRKALTVMRLGQVSVRCLVYKRSHGRGHAVFRLSRLSNSLGLWMSAASLPPLPFTIVVIMVMHVGVLAVALAQLKLPTLGGILARWGECVLLLSPFRVLRWHWVTLRSFGLRGMFPPCALHQELDIFEVCETEFV